MQSRNARLAGLFLDKPDLVWPLPDWLLPPEQMDDLRGRPGLAVVELAGRDSVAAALKAVAEQGLTDLVPTYVYTGSEYGPWDSVAEARRRLAARLPAGVRVHPLLVYGAPSLWRALVGRPAAAHFARFGLSAFCVGCHLYLHALRLPLAIALGRAAVIAGERESHDGRVKINQVAASLDGYQALYAGFGVPLLTPLRHAASGREVEQWLGGADWAEGGDQLGCVLSGNYCDPAGAPIYDPAGLKTFLADYALPLTRAWLEGLLAAAAPDPVKAGLALLATPARA